MKKILIIFLLLFTNSQVLTNDKQDSKDTANISEQLKTLQDLYKAGVLSGYEYETEKKRILNR